VDIYHQWWRTFLCPNYLQSIMVIGWWISTANGEGHSCVHIIPSPSWKLACGYLLPMVIDIPVSTLSPVHHGNWLVHIYHHPFLCPH
jgi:hypothetical protein